jgi:hypothetical protein
MSRRTHEPMPATEQLTTSELVKIVTNLEDAVRSLPAEERERYEDAQRSVVEARNHATFHEGQIKLI